MLATEYALQQFYPSQQAAAIVCAARRHLRLQPAWCEALAALTGHAWGPALAAIVDLIEAHFRDNFSASPAGLAASPASPPALAYGTHGTYGTYGGASPSSPTSLASLSH